MATIKDKLEIFTSQIEAFQEVTEEQLTQAATDIKVIYEPVDSDDPIEQLLSVAIDQQHAGIEITRQTAGLYMIQGKSVTMAADGENNDQLKVRVGSTWFAFADYMAQVKAKMERDAAAEEGEVQASLETPGTDAPANVAAGGKKKKKKAKKKKAKAAELDLDMEVDDAAEQTRFAGLVKSDAASTDSMETASSERRDSIKKRRKSVRTKRAKGHLSALAEVSEDDEDEDEDSSSEPEAIAEM